MLRFDSAGIALVLIALLVVVGTAQQMLYLQETLRNAVPLRNAQKDDWANLAAYIARHLDPTIATVARPPLA